jgi:hypothetical protein
MNDIKIKNEIVQILSSDASQDDKVKQIEILIEQVKVAYYVMSANDISRELSQKRRSREQAVLEQTKTGKVVSLHS